MSRLKGNWRCVVLLWLCACGTPPVVIAPVDAGMADAGMSDAGVIEVDAGVPDAGIVAVAPAWSTTTGTPIEAGLWGSVLSWDAPAHRFILHGGNRGTTEVSNETWAFDADMQAWSRLNTTGSPPLRYCHCAVVLPNQRQLLIIGGRDASQPVESAYTLDLITLVWSQVTGNVPVNGIGCTAHWVPSLERALVFGGEGFGGLSNQTWAFDAEARTFTVLDDGVVMGPAGRRDAMSAFDAERGWLLMFGGAVSIRRSYLDDLAIFNGTRWLTFEPPTARPSPRRYGASGIDPINHRWVIFGGTDDFDDFADTWLVDTTTFAFTRLEISGPSARGFAASGVDPRDGTLYVFGGFTGSGQMKNDGWRFK